MFKLVKQGKHLSVLLFFCFFFNPSREYSYEENFLFLIQKKIKFFFGFLQRVVKTIVFKMNSNQKDYFDATSINRSLQAE